MHTNVQKCLILEIRYLLVSLPMHSHGLFKNVCFLFVCLLLSSSLLRTLSYMRPILSSNSSSVMDCCGGSCLSKTLLLIQSHEV